MKNSFKVFEIIRAQKANAYEIYGFQDEELNFIKAALKKDVPDHDRENQFLYEIVKNRRIGIDCNTFNKILRDCYFVGVKSSFNYMRIVENATVCKV